jgi:hypothetical protein
MIAISRCSALTIRKTAVRELSTDRREVAFLSQRVRKIWFQTSLIYAGGRSWIRFRPRETMVAQFKLTEVDPPREPRAPKTAPRLRDGSLMLLTPALISAPVHAPRLAWKLKARSIAAQQRLDLGWRPHRLPVRGFGASGPIHSK